MKIEVYADGSATTADKPGGYGWVMVIDKEKISEGSGQIPNATNNDAELEAAIMGLAEVLRFITNKETGEREPAAWNTEIILVSDSQIILNWANGSHRFKQKKKMQKFIALKSLMQRLQAKTRWVRGHSGDEHNERCDKLAGAARKGLAIQQQKEIKSGEKSLINKKKLGTMSFWYKGVLKIIDLDINRVEEYDKEIHGVRRSHLELRIDEKK